MLCYLPRKCVFKEECSHRVVIVIMAILSPFWANLLESAQAMPAAKANVSCVQSTAAPETEYNGPDGRALPLVRTLHELEFDSYCKDQFHPLAPKQPDVPHQDNCVNHWACKRLSTTHETIPTHMFSYVHHIDTEVDAADICGCTASIYHPLHLRRANSTEDWKLEAASDSFIITGYSCSHKKECRKYNC